ncbi:winged helix-turn-helix transcriptional regulator [Ralstonia nicotianae]
MGGKWTILAISVLAEQPRRFNGLKRLIGGISQQMLTRTLKALEHDGMVTRTVPPPPHRAATGGIRLNRIGNIPFRAAAAARPLGSRSFRRNRSPPGVTRRKDKAVASFG